MTSEVWPFENAGVWTITAGTASKQASTVRSEGSFSLALTAPAYVAVRGTGVSKPAVISPIMALDVMIPTQVGPYYLGALQMSVNVPSLGIYSAWVNQKQLSVPTGVWQTITFEIPADTYSNLLAAPFDDLEVTIGLNPPFGITQPFRLDNLRFQPSPTCVGIADGTLCDDSVTCTTGNLCSAGTCGAVTAPGVCDAGDDVLGFENFQAWLATAGASALAPSSTRVQGLRSLSITTPNFTTVQSVNLATLHKVSQTLSLRVQKPTHQPNQWWHGEVVLNMAAPSLGINFSSTKPLVGQPSGSFFELQFAVPAATYQALAVNNYNDLQFSISINPPSGQTGSYLLDDLHFVPVTSCTGVLDKTACEDSSMCTQGDSCIAGTCGVAVTCDDSNACTDDSCAPGTGCIFTNNTAACDDSNVCTIGDVCAGGACIPGAAASCNDGSNCTNDSCDPAAGCVFADACGGGTCHMNACCSPQTCLSLGAECGVHDDGCGGGVDCSGLCPAGGSCNPAFQCLPPNNFDEETGINVCEILLEDLLIPAVTHEEVACGDFGGWDCVIDPFCCVPIVCLAYPQCLVWDVVVDVPEILLNAGDVYCDFRSPNEYLEKLLNGAINTTEHFETFFLTGGLSGLFDFHLATMATAGSDVPSHVKQLVRDLTAPVYDGGATGFHYDDMDDVKIVSSDFPTAGLYLPGERTAITLGPVIILQPNLYEALFSSSNNGVTYSDFLTDPAVCQTYVAAVDILMHELVHVRQYHELGRYNFLTQYFASALVNGGYGEIGFEEEAFAYHIGLSELQGGNYCSVTAAFHSARINSFSLPIPHNTCTPTGLASIADFPFCP